MKGREKKPPNREAMLCRLLTKHNAVTCNGCVRLKSTDTQSVGGKAEKRAKERAYYATYKQKRADYYMKNRDRLKEIRATNRTQKATYDANYR